MNVHKSINYAFKKRENAAVFTTIKKRNSFLTTVCCSISSKLTNMHLHPSTTKPEQSVENISSRSSPLPETDPRFSKGLLQGSQQNKGDLRGIYKFSHAHCGTCHLQGALREDFAPLFTTLRDALIVKAQFCAFLTRWFTSH